MFIALMITYDWNIYLKANLFFFLISFSFFWNSVRMWLKNGFRGIWVVFEPKLDPQNRYEYSFYNNKYAQNAQTKVVYLYCVNFTLWQLSKRSLKVFNMNSEQWTECSMLNERISVHSFLHLYVNCINKFLGPMPKSYAFQQNRFSLRLRHW